MPKIEWLELITWEHICSSVILFSCVVKFVALFWFNVKETMSKEVDDFLVVSVNNNSQITSKNTKPEVRFAYKIPFKKI